MTRVWSLTVGLFLGALVLSAQAAAPLGGDEWLSLKFHLFGERVMHNDEGARLSLQLPERAADAGAVPLGITIRSNPGGSGVRKAYIVIDKYPSPV